MAKAKLKRAKYDVIELEKSRSMYRILLILSIVIYFATVLPLSFMVWQAYKKLRGVDVADPMAQQQLEDIESCKAVCNRRPSSPHWGPDGGLVGCVCGITD